MVRKNKTQGLRQVGDSTKVDPRGQLYEVKWLDAYEESAGWHSIEDALKMRPKPVLSVGYLLWKQKEFTIIAGDIDPSLVDLLKQANTLEELLTLIKKSGLDGSDCGRVTVIPGQWIVEIKIIL